MIWKNLAEFKCPHCSAPLLKREEENEIVCTKCHFVISETRFESIKNNRTGEPKNLIRMHWQNLHDSKCPICGIGLKIDKRSFRRCGDENCKFAIGHYKFEFIIKDPDHPANRFYKPAIGLDKILDI